jgi:hypothetical protein
MTGRGMAMLSKEAAVETNDTGSITGGNGSAQQQRPRLASVRIWRFEPRRKGGVGIDFAPLRQIPIKRRLNIGGLRARCHLSQVLVLGAQLRKFRLDRIDRSAPREIDECHNSFSSIYEPFWIVFAFYCSKRPLF